MSELSILQLCLITLTFVWSGFVRSGLGFGGAAPAVIPVLLLQIKSIPKPLSEFRPAVVFIQQRLLGSRCIWTHGRGAATDQGNDESECERAKDPCCHFRTGGRVVAPRFISCRSTLHHCPFRGSAHVFRQASSCALNSARSISRWKRGR